ncbi:mechanosensitive ion channel family protein [Gracilimonas sediminicola]|uniref:Mechanosensitive ion channel family protein n=1 Tax=Gracilimonas sediminicola TaxID=2952158 RepID=A0A9X2RHA5_9BACT|nr:mechanosensitive ion channel family protein [Gracilimonas sediminicola]MCP9292992.1 mechanosensitive ion channel family protein [Gracilimonas sediminicola]
MKELLSTYIDEIWHLPILIGMIILITIVIAGITSRVLNAIIKRNREAEDNDDVTSLVFFKRSIIVLIYLAGISFAIYMIPQLRVIAASLLAGAGLLAVAVGFASQAALSNVISGLFIVLFKPYKISDRIEVRTDLTGVVEDINLRHTVIRNFENKRIIIPNSVISNEVVINSNYEDNKICKWIDMGISYDSDIDLAKKIMEEEVLKHPHFVDVRTEEQIEAGDDIVPVRVVMMGESSVNLRAWSWASNPPDAFVMGCDLLESIKKRFDAEGIEIPFPYRTLVYKNNPPKSIEGGENARS